MAAVEGLDLRAGKAEPLLLCLLDRGRGVLAAPDQEGRPMEPREGRDQPLHRRRRRGPVAATHRPPGSAVEVIPEPVERRRGEPAADVVEPALEALAGGEQLQDLTDEWRSHRLGQRMPAVADKNAGAEEDCV